MKENQRITVTKRMLKEGLLRLLETKKLDKIRVNELCEESGINRATFYRHYETPHDVLMELSQDLLREMKPMGQIPKTRQELDDRMTQLCEFLDEHTQLLRLIILNHTDEDLEQLVKMMIGELWSRTSGSGRFRELDQETLNILVTFSVGGGYYLLRQWLLGNIRKTPQEMGKLVSDLVSAYRAQEFGAAM